MPGYNFDRDGGLSPRAECVLVLLLFGLWITSTLTVLAYAK